LVTTCPSVFVSRLAVIDFARLENLGRRTREIDVDAVKVAVKESQVQVVS
jgi:hypothetical protein